VALEAYFSHSGREKDVPLNVFVWQTVAQDCVLYVDRDGAEKGAYYINRLEELIRKSDVFISVLAHRANPAASAEARPDYRLECSHWALFEIRLAERARKPRWIVFDDRTFFVPPDTGSDIVVYTPIATLEELARGGRTIRKAGNGWLQRVRDTLSDSARGRARRAALLIDESAADAREIRTILERALRQAGHGHVVAIDPLHTDAEAIAILQSSGLLVAEMGASVSDVYGMAHAMFIPTIRFIRARPEGPDIPRLLNGHPGGYQHDLIFVEDKEVLERELTARANAMRDERRPIEGLNAGCAYLRRPLYRPHRVFFSHNVGTSDADLLSNVFKNLESLGIRAWEYRQNNQAGVVWRDELKTALMDATDVVFVLGNDFELSEVCAQEMKTLMARRAEFRSVTPFLWGGRDRHSPELTGLYHEPLPSDKVAAAEIIVERLRTNLSIKAEPDTEGAGTGFAPHGPR
jgi:hypothetical protein